MSSANDTIRREVADRDQLSRGTRAYFQARTQNRLYNLVMRKFREKKEAEGLTQAQVARRMGKRPEVVNRLFAGPGNWGSDTLSDLLLAIAGEEIDDESSSPLDKPATNRRSRDRDRHEYRSYERPTGGRTETTSRRGVECGMVTRLRCYVRGSDDHWEGMCLDLDLAVTGRSEQEVKNLLEHAVMSYIQDASEEDPKTAAKLLSRRAPLSVRLGIQASALVSTLLSLGNTSSDQSHSHRPITYSFHCRA